MRRATGAPEHKKELPPAFEHSGPRIDWSPIFAVNAVDLKTGASAVYNAFISTPIERNWTDGFIRCRKDMWSWKNTLFLNAQRKKTTIRWPFVKTARKKSFCVNPWFAPTGAFRKRRVSEMLQKGSSVHIRACASSVSWTVFYVFSFFLIYDNGLTAGW